MRTVGLSYRLRERVTIEEKNLVDNGRGGRKRPEGGPEWNEVATVWAEVIGLRGDEALSHLVQRAVQLWRVTIRLGTNVTPAHRLVWNSVPMNIRSIAPTPQRDALVMVCESGVPG